MARKKEEQQETEEISKENFAKWLQEKNSAENLIEKYAKSFNKANSVLREEIDDSSPLALREQIKRTFNVLPSILSLQAKTEQHYREMQKKASTAFPAWLRSDARKMWLDGECSDFRYRRDVVEHLLQGLRDKLSAQKALLSSLHNEIREQGFID